MLHILSSALFLLLSTFAIKTTNPPGTVPLQYNVFIDQNELSNSAWIEYINWLSRTHGETSMEVQNAMPDNTAFSALYKEDFNPSTFRNKYVNYPVVGVSYAQAVAYCAWRSDRVNQLESIEEKVQYRLPTKEEFVEAKELEKAATTKNFNEDLQLFSVEEKRNEKQVYQLTGNIAEMTSEEGIAFLENKDNHSCEIEYIAPNKNLGFRCVAEVR